MGTTLSIRWLSIVAFVGFFWWGGTVLLLHAIAPEEYSPVRQAISELTHYDYGILLDVSFFPFGIAGIAVAAGLYRTVRGVWLAPILLVAASLLWMSLGIFRTGADGVFDTETASTGAMIHDTAAFVSFLLVMVVVFLFARAFRRDAAWGSFARPTMFWTIVTVGSFLLFPILGEDRFGVAQRIFIAIWLSWLLVVSWRLWRIGSGVTQT